MPTVQLSAASLATLIQDLASTPDHDDTVTLTITNEALRVKVNDGPWSEPLGTAMPSSRPTLYPYVDLSAGLITEQEMTDIDCAPTTVTVHESGAWIHVPYPEADDALEAETPPDDWKDFPNLRHVLLAARRAGARRVNLDSDGVDLIDHLPTFDW